MQRPGMPHVSVLIDARETSICCTHSICISTTTHNNIHSVKCIHMFMKTPESFFETADNMALLKVLAKLISTDPESYEMCGDILELIGVCACACVRVSMRASIVVLRVRLHFMPGLPG